MASPAAVFAFESAVVTELQTLLEAYTTDVQLASISSESGTREAAVEAHIRVPGNSVAGSYSLWVSAAGCCITE